MCPWCFCSKPVSPNEALTFAEVVCKNHTVIKITSTLLSVCFVQACVSLARSVMLVNVQDRGL